MLYWAGQMLKASGQVKVQEARCTAMVCLWLTRVPLVCPACCRYVYMACAVRPTNIGNGLAKMDLETGHVKTWNVQGGITGEPCHMLPGGISYHIIA